MHALLFVAHFDSMYVYYFSNVLQEYRDRMKLELSSQNDPLDANLEKVLPSLHEWHRINRDEMSNLKQAVATIDVKMSDVHTKIDDSFTEMKGVLISNRQQTKKELAGTFLEVAKYLVKDVGGELSDSTTVADILGPSRMTPEDPVDDTDPVQDTEPSSISETNNSLFRMKPKHLYLLELVHEWYGTGDWYDGYGGIQGRNGNKNLKGWRTQCCINQMHYSRTERTVKAVNEYANRNSIDKYQAAVALQESYERCKCSVANFVTWAQSEQLLEKKRARGKSTRTANVDAETGII